MEATLIKNFKFIAIVLSLFVFLPAYANESKRFEDIQNQLSKWQSILNAEKKYAAVIYRYAWGANFESEEWLIKPIESDSKRLAEKISFLKSKAGAWVLKEDFSFSGDWVIKSEHYYDERGRLFFILWKMNTFQAEEPVTVGKKLYFDQYGNVILNLVEVYKLNTHQVSNAKYIDREVVYETSFNKQNFLKYFNKDLAQFRSGLE